MTSTYKQQQKYGFDDMDGYDSSEEIFDIESDEEDIDDYDSDDEEIEECKTKKKLVELKDNGLTITKEQEQKLKKMNRFERYMNILNNVHILTIQ